MIQRELQKLFTKEMDRREFLAHVGAGILAVIGISGLIKHLVNYNQGGGQSRSDRDQRFAVSGYGSSAYGGRKR